MTKREREIEKLLSLAEHTNYMVSDVLHLVRRIFQIPTSIHHSFNGENMPLTFTVGQTAIETITESNAAGNVPVIGANITDTSSDPTIASVVSNGDGTATWTAIAPGTVTDTFADTVNNLSGTDTVTVIAAIQVPTAIANSFAAPTGV